MPCTGRVLTRRPRRRPSKNSIPGKKVHEENIISSTITHKNTIKAITMTEIIQELTKTDEKMKDKSNQIDYLQEAIASNKATLLIS